MDRFHLKEEEFIELLDAYARYMNLQLHRYNLNKYGIDPEDILQDVRVRIWKLVQSDRTILKPASYIKRIVSSAVIDQIRKHRRDGDLLYHEKQKRISEEGFSYSGEALHKKAFEETVGKAVERLIDSRRQVVKLYLMNFTIQEIASYLNWSQDKTRNLLYRGLADIKKSLKAQGVENE
jgi:RNA polymerase sigma-70 factor (ECF subfamily)